MLKQKLRRAEFRFAKNENQNTKQFEKQILIPTTEPPTKLSTPSKFDNFQLFHILIRADFITSHLAFSLHFLTIQNL